MKILQILLLGAFLTAGFQAEARVIINSPSNGATVSSPVLLTASNHGSLPALMAVYVNGSLSLQSQAVSSINTSLTLDAGDYTIKILAVSESGRISVAAIHITVAAGSTTPPVTTPPATGGTTSAADQIAADMQATNEGYPHGVPLSWDWANGPVIDMGNNSNGQQAITAWGVVYVAAQGNPATNTRVNIRNVQLYFLQQSTGEMAPFCKTPVRRMGRLIRKTIRAIPFLETCAPNPTERYPHYGKRK